MRVSILLPQCRHKEGVYLVKPQLITVSTPTGTSHPQIPEQVSKFGRFLVVLISIMGGHIIRFVVLSLIQLKMGERGH